MFARSGPCARAGAAAHSAIRIPVVVAGRKRTSREGTRTGEPADSLVRSLAKQEPRMPSLRFLAALACVGAPAFAQEPAAPAAPAPPAARLEALKGDAV